MLVNRSLFYGSFNVLFYKCNNIEYELSFKNYN